MSVRWILGLAFVLACTTSQSVMCPHGIVCPGGDVCDVKHDGCVLPGQLTTCIGLPELAACSVDGKDIGICRDEVCVIEQCGDHAVTGTEECDGEVMPKTDCKQLGYYESAPLSCNRRCAYDVSACGSICGDNVVDVAHGEQCEGSDLAGADCTTAGYYFPAGLQCNAACRFDATACTGTCGDGMVNDASERCDGSPPSSGSCTDFGFDIGPLGCSAFCTPGFDDCGFLGWRKMLAQPTSYLFGVWASSTTDAFAVGDGGVILHYDGIAWTPQASGTTVALLAVSGTSKTHVYAVGVGGAVLFFNGTSWTQVASPTSVTLSAVYAAPTGEVFASGASGELVRFDGTSWIRDTPRASGDLGAIWGSSASDVYAGGAGGSLFHWNGTGWSTATSPTSSLINAIAGTGPNDVYLAANAIYRFDGSWSQVASLSYAMYGGAANQDQVAFVGDSGAYARRTELGWEIAQTAGGAHSFTAVTVASDGHIFAVGEAGQAYEHEGHTWLPSTPTTPIVFDIWGTGPDDVFAAGTRSFQCIVAHFDGASWAEQTLSGAICKSVWGSGSNDVYVTTIGGVIQHYTGTWSTDTIAGDWRGIWGVSASSVYAVGAGGAVAHRTAGSWIPVSQSATTSLLYDVWASADDNIFAVSQAGEVIHFDGATWTKQALSSSPLYGLHGTGTNDIFAVGVSGQIFHFDGTQWTAQPSGTLEELDRVWARTPNDVYAAGTGPTLLHYDGKRWAPVRSPVIDVSFAGVWSTAKTVFVGAFNDLADTDTQILTLDTSVPL